jgi:protein-disulfide isomerase
MNNEQKKSNSIFVFGLLVIFVLVLGGIYWYYISKNAKTDQVNTKKPITQEELLEQELKRIKNNNSSVLDQADKTVLKVRDIDNTDHVLGEMSAPVQLIVYTDFESPFCAEFFDTSKEIQELFGESVVIAVRHYPLTSHSNALPAAIASECAAEQGKFWEMHEKMFEGNKNDEFGIEYYNQYAQDLELDMTKYKDCIDEEKYKEKIQDHITEARESAVTGAPGSFVNKEPVPGAVPFKDFVGTDGKTREGMKSIIQRHLDKISNS